MVILPNPTGNFTHGDGGPNLLVPPARKTSGKRVPGSCLVHLISAISFITCEENSKKAPCGGFLGLLGRNATFVQLMRCDVLTVSIRGDIEQFDLAGLVCEPELQVAERLGLINTVRKAERFGCKTRFCAEILGGLLSPCFNLGKLFPHGHVVEAAHLTCYCAVPGHPCSPLSNMATGYPA